MTIDDMNAAVAVLEAKQEATDVVLENLRDTLQRWIDEMRGLADQMGGTNGESIRARLARMEERLIAQERATKFWARLFSAGGLAVLGYLAKVAIFP